MNQPTVLRHDEGPVRVLTINRPAVRNAVDLATIRLLGREVAAAGQEDAVRVLVVMGAGGVAFSAGGDMSEWVGDSALASDTAMEAWQTGLEHIARSPKPVIAAVEGYAYGGGTEIAMACHIRLAADDAKFGQTEIVHDHLPGGGGTQRLPRLVPLGLAYEYLLTGDPIPAAEAWRIGLVNHVWPKSEFRERTLAFAARLAERAPVAVRLTLEAIREGLNGPLDAGLRLERALAGLAMESEEAQRGLEAFLSKKRKART